MALYSCRVVGDLRLVENDILTSAHCQLSNYFFYLYLHFRNGARKKYHSCSTCTDFRYHQKNCGKEHKCETCWKIFNAKENLTQHKKIHTTDCQCADCGKCLASKIMLSRHQTKHSKNKDYICTECNSKFTLLQIKKNVKKFHSK